METWFLVLGVIFAIIGLAGAVVPALPGPPISYAALWMMWLYDSTKVSMTTLIVAGLLMVAITILDYVAPIWLTKKGHGTKAGMRGATAGMIVGLFFGPLGLILGPFMGAFIGELLVDTPFKKALKVAFMSFVGFLMTTAIKIIYSIAVIMMLVGMFI